MKLKLKSLLKLLTLPIISIPAISAVTSCSKKDEFKVITPENHIDLLANTDYTTKDSFKIYLKEEQIEDELDVIFTLKSGETAPEWIKVNSQNQIVINGTGSQVPAGSLFNFYWTATSKQNPKLSYQSKTPIEIHFLSQDESFNFEKTTDNTYLIGGLSGKQYPSEIEIPSKHDNLPVSGFINNSFSDENLTNVESIKFNFEHIESSFNSINNAFPTTFKYKLVFGENVRIIDDNIFHTNKQITGLDFTLSQNLTKIGEQTFAGLNCIKDSITLPDSVSYIGSGAFSYCEYATGDIILPSSLKILGNNAYHNYGKLSSSPIGKIDISKATQLLAIPSQSFQEINTSTNINITANIQRIDTWSFANVEAPSLDLSNATALVYISEGAFYSFSATSGNQDIKIPSSVSTIETQAFWAAKGFNDIYFLGTVAPQVGKNWVWQNFSGKIYVKSEGVKQQLLAQENFGISEDKIIVNSGIN